ncbi:hypothetical protein OPV22_005317 [Ensete ventricosum]|uniref:Uncharacterized protein n=1 Tax=Ensete ventricosum TaxID=4639 RepID=A0AAV8Q2H2_ENSVE|nr:hypothetical protein OPV22_005317 [Ensete ventricosum]
MGSDVKPAPNPAGGLPGEARGASRIVGSPQVPGLLLSSSSNLDVFMEVKLFSDERCPTSSELCIRR